MAIVAGTLGNYLVENMGLGRVAPFDAAIVALVAGGIIIMATWGENYGDQHSKGIAAQFSKGWNAIVTGGQVVAEGSKGQGAGCVVCVRAYQPICWFAHCAATDTFVCAFLYALNVKHARLSLSAVVDMHACAPC